MLLVKRDESQNAQVVARNGVVGLAESFFQLIENHLPIAGATKRNVEVTGLLLFSFAARHFQFGLRSLQITENEATFRPGFAAVLQREQRLGAIQFGLFPNGIAGQDFDSQLIRRERKAEFVRSYRNVVCVRQFNAKALVQHLAHDDRFFRRDPPEH